MNYSKEVKEVVHFAQMLSALQSAPSSNPLFSPSSYLDLSSSSSSSLPFGRSLLIPSSKISFHALANPVVESDSSSSSLYSHLEPTLHGLPFQESTELLNVNGTIGGVLGDGNGENYSYNAANAISYFTIFWGVMFTIMLSFACIGNILVIWIVLAHRRMRSVTNYFLLNLSVADFLLAFLNGFPNSFYMLRHDWIFGSILCVVNNFVANFTVASCVFTMMSISLDRYMAIVRPLQPRMTKRMAWKAIVAIWMCSAILGLPCLLFSTTETYFDGTSTKTKCFIQWPDGNPTESRLDFLYTIFLLVLTYIVPMTAMAMCYGSMSLELWGHRQIGECSERQINSMISKRKVVRMFIVIVFVFATCWAPYHGYFIYVYYNKSIVFKKWLPAVYLTFYFLAMSTSCSNVLVYYMMNTKFRSYIQEVARNMCFCCKRNSRNSRDFIGETPPLFRRYSQSNSRSRSGPTDEHICNSPFRKLPKQHGNLVLQNHIHYYRHPVNNCQVNNGGRTHHVKRVSKHGPHGTAVTIHQNLHQNHHHQGSLKTCNTYC